MLRRPRGWRPGPATSSWSTREHLEDAPGKQSDSPCVCGPLGFGELSRKSTMSAVWLVAFASGDWPQFSKIRFGEIHHHFWTIVLAYIACLELHGSSERQGALVKVCPHLSGMGSRSSWSPRVAGARFSRGNSALPGWPLRQTQYARPLSSSVPREARRRLPCRIAGNSCDTSSTSWTLTASHRSRRRYGYI